MILELRVKHNYSISFLRFTFLEISIVLYLQTTRYLVKIIFQNSYLKLLQVVFTLIMEWKFKKDSGCSLIEYDIYFKEGES